MTPLRIGDVLHGYCGGAFGRDHYACSRVEAIGSDFVVVREVETAYRGVWFSVGDPDSLAEYRDNREYCDCD